MTSGLQYLTVQDVLFAHFRIVGKPTDFHYDALEEATFCQYGYGASHDLMGQAASFAKGFRQLMPFQTANRAVGFVTLVAFLVLNGKAPSISDYNAAEWFDQVSRSVSPEAIAAAFADSAAHHPASPQSAIMETLGRFPSTVEALVAEESPVTSS